MAVTLRGVSKKVRNETHIYGIDLNLTEGSFNVLLGTTLAGKTTLMRMMAGLEKPTTGEVWFKGKNVTGVPVQKRSVSMVYQQFINYPQMTVFDNIASPLKLQGMGKADIKSRVGKVAELLQISAILERYPRNLSGGQQQRTALARALVKNSELILLDEPLANLDYKLREELREELPKLMKESGSTIVYATTEPSEALLLGGSTVCLFEGRVTQVGPALELYRKPKDIVSANIYSEPPMNQAMIKKVGNEFILNATIRWPVPDRYKRIPDSDYIAGLRPHHLTLTPPGANHTMIAGIVRIVEITGSESMIHVTVANAPWISLSHGVHPFQVGEQATLYMDINHFFYFYPDGRRVEVM